VSRRGYPNFVISIIPSVIPAFNSQRTFLVNARLVRGMGHDCHMTTALAELPLVNGRHRNRALAASRRAQAVQLKAAGLTYAAIATEMGYANRGTVFRIISEALRAQNVEAVEELRNLEVARLDTLQLAMWPAAMSGDVHAASVVTRVIMTRCRLLGLEGPSVLTVDAEKPRTLVVPPVT
jgi:pantothenate synthetase